MSASPPEPARSVCLVFNTESGNYSEEAIADIRTAVRAGGGQVMRTVDCSHDEVPSAAALDDAGISCVAVFGGDGTISSVTRGLAGWGGAVLPLPGGTMNLLCRRLHADAPADEIIARALRGEASRIAMPMIGTAAEGALVNISAGPGTQWYHVRETMRDGTLGETLADAREAAGDSVAGPQVRCASPDWGRAQGYPLIELVPEEGGIAVVAYTADDMLGYLRQGIAIARRRFRDGPHETLGVAREIALACTQGEPLGLSVDGEPRTGEPHMRFALATCPVDLIATAP